MNVRRRVLIFISIDYGRILDLLKDCEVRAGLKSDTWIKVLRTGKVREQQVGQDQTIVGLTFR